MHGSRPEISRRARIWLAKTVRFLMAWEHKWFLVVMLMALLAGVLLAKDYGQSWDEWTNYKYGEIYLRAYFEPGIVDRAAIDYYHAPFYFMLWVAMSKFIDAVMPWLQPFGARHLSNYLCFLMGLVAFYSLAVRLLKKPIAMATTVLFGLQPFLYGHAFINQKDIPFMAFFTLSIAAGIGAVDFTADQGHAMKVGPQGSREAIWELKNDWMAASRVKRLGLLVLLLLVVVLTLDAGFQFLLWPSAKTLVAHLYMDPSTPVLGWLFRLVAQDAHKTPLDIYLSKLAHVYSWFRYAIAAGAWIFLAGGIIHFFGSYWVPERIRRVRAWVLWVLAGVALGLTTSIRIIGPFAGLLVCIYALMRLRGRSLPRLVSYGAVALATTYLTWPALWADPVAGFANRLSTTASFEAHAVLYGGRIIPSYDLPWHYVPKILAIKFTEPALILILAGLALGFYSAMRNAVSVQLITILALWFIVPIISASAKILPLYGDRQIFFALPPLLLFAGLGLRIVLDAIESQWFRMALLVGVLMPGIAGIIRLHPYEYVYYNGLVGGVRGAEGQYQLDYWCTSYREAMEYINRIAQPGAIVKAWGPDDAAREFARDDLKVFPLDSFDADYVLGCSRAIRRANFLSRGKILHEVKIDGAVLAVVLGPQ